MSVWTKNNFNEWFEKHKVENLIKVCKSQRKAKFKVLRKEEHDTNCKKNVTQIKHNSLPSDKGQVKAKINATKQEKTSQRSHLITITGKEYMLAHQEAK